MGLTHFYTGWHQPVKGPSGCQNFSLCMVSVNRLIGRKSPDFPVNNWGLDSGAFSRFILGLEHMPVSNYARLIFKFAHNGILDFVVPQDYLCDPYVRGLTGKSTEESQRLTIERYEQLLAFNLPTYLMPVLQGYHPHEYVKHLRDYGDRIPPNAWVGVGSLCKRNSNPSLIAAVLMAIKSERPDLRLHGFGVKKKSLNTNRMVWDLLYSADSAAGTLCQGQGSNKYEGSNDPQRAIAYANSIRPPEQLSIFSIWE
jgi:hypothetical protein